jgi:hypothetical protein
MPAASSQEQAMSSGGPSMDPMASTCEQCRGRHGGRVLFQGPPVKSLAGS